MKAVKVGLIKGRHQMPVDKYIFESDIQNVHDYAKISATIMSFLETEVSIGIYTGQALNSYDYTDVQCLRGNKNLEVYVTGLTPVTAELIKLCALNGISLTLFNFNSESRNYERQVIF
ncbi:hypothetical protein [Filifactor alocis]|uniref:hypothetical protein n=1 Tax=Filifactor alocis TaxID=143361 RepID=UPI003F9F46AA